MILKSLPGWFGDVPKCDDAYFFQFFVDGLLSIIIGIFVWIIRWMKSNTVRLPFNISIFDRQWTVFADADTSWQSVLGLFERRHEKSHLSAGLVIHSARKQYMYKQSHFRSTAQEEQKNTNNAANTAWFCAANAIFAGFAWFAYFIWGKMTMNGKHVGLRNW